MATKTPTKRMTRKSPDAQSHNPDMSSLIEKVKQEKGIPFQVRLDPELLTRVGLYKAESRKTHKTIVSEALEKYLPAKK